MIVSVSLTQSHTHAGEIVSAPGESCGRNCSGPAPGVAVVVTGVAGGSLDGRAVRPRFSLYHVSKCFLEECVTFLTEKVRRLRVLRPEGFSQEIVVKASRCVEGTWRSRQHYNNSWETVFLTLYSQAVQLRTCEGWD